MNNQNKSATPAAFLQRLSLIIILLIAGQLIFLGVVVFLHLSGIEPMQPSLAPVLLLAFTAAAGVGAMAGHLIYDRQLAQARRKGTLLEKLQAYQSATIIRFATFEAGGMMAIVGYLLTGHILFLVLLLAVLIVQVLLFPTVERGIAALKLSVDERDIIYHQKEWPHELPVE